METIKSLKNFIESSIKIIDELQKEKDLEPINVFSLIVIILNIKL